MPTRIAWSLAALTACGPIKAPADASDTGHAETTGHAASTTALAQPTTGNILASDASTSLFTTTSSASTSTAISDTATFIVGQDVAVDPEPAACDRLLQDCPGGQKCTAYANSGTNWDATKCVPVAEDPKHSGEVCTVEGNGVSGIDDCDAKSYCWDTDAQNKGICVAVCKGTAEEPLCEEAGKLCTYLTDLASFVSRQLRPAGPGLRSGRRLYRLS